MKFDLNVKTFTICRQYFEKVNRFKKKTKYIICTFSHSLIKNDLVDFFISKLTFSKKSESLCK